MTQPKEINVTLFDPKTKKRFPCLISKVGWACSTYGYVIEDANEYTRLLREGAPEVVSQEPAIRPEPATLPEVTQGDVVRPASVRKPRPAMSARMVPEP